MMATGSIEGWEYGMSRVATLLTQSVEPGSGTSSTLKPPYQPNLLAIANGAAAELTVRAHQPTRTVVCACACPATAAAVAANNAAAMYFLITRRLPCFARARHRPSATDPRTARG